MKLKLPLIFSFCAAMVGCSGSPEQTQVQNANNAPAAETKTPSASTGDSAGGELKVYIWSDYVDENTWKEFLEKYKIKGTYESYDSNETLEAKVLTGKSGYDLVAPGSANIGRQIQAGAYLPLDKSKIPNYKNVSPELLKLLDSVDPGNKYVVPYFFGTNTIGVNREAVDKALGGKWPENLWDLVFKPEYTAKLKSCGISYLDSPSEVFPLALHYLGLDPASSKSEDLQKAYDLMKSVRKDIKRFSSSGYINDLARGDLCVVIGYGGDINIAVNRAKEAGAKYTVEALAPREGMGLWVDNLAIPKDAANVENAYKYINWTLDPNIAARNATFVTYSPGSEPAKALIPEELIKNRSIFPDEEDMKKGFIIKPFSPEGIRMTVRLWLNLKAD